MTLLYTIAPYSAPTTIQVQNNIHEASIMAQYYWLKGFAVICPQLNSGNFDGLVSDETFLNGTMEMLKQCSHVVVHPEWKKSTGSINEHIWAKDNYLTMYFPESIELLKYKIDVMLEKDRT